MRNRRISDFISKNKKHYAWIDIANELKMAKNEVQNKTKTLSAQFICTHLCNLNVSLTFY